MVNFIVEMIVLFFLGGGKDKEKELEEKYPDIFGDEDIDPLENQEMNIIYHNKVEKNYKEIIRDRVIFAFKIIIAIAILFFLYIFTK